MQDDANSGIDDVHAPHSFLVIVPRTGPDLWRSLRRSLGGDAGARVILDRRCTDRRARADPHGTERRREERRRRSTDAELKTGRWVAVPCASGRADILDADGQAILFLCCGDHVVPCQKCQTTYRLRWIPRAEPGVFACARCGTDLTPIVVAHVQTCRYWIDRSTGTTPPTARADFYDTPAQSATG